MRYIEKILLFVLLSITFVFAQNDIKNVHQQVKTSNKYNRIIPKLEVESADLQSVLLMLSEYSGIDIVSAVRAKTTVTISLRKKSWQEALNIICKIYKLTPVVSENYIYVMPTSEYKQMLLDDAQKNVQLENVEPLKMKIIKVNNSKASEMSEAVQKLLSKRGNTTVVDRTNSIIVVDTKKNLDQIEKIIVKLDTETPQVMIEAKLITVDKDKERELGIQWNMLAMNNGSPLANISSAPGTADPMVSVSNASGVKLDVAPGGFKVAQITGINLQYMSSKLDGQIIANPQITTLDNKEASIFMGEKVPVRTIDASGKATYQLVEAGTKLVVKPHITQDHKILMELKPNKKSYFVDPQLQSPIFKEQSAETEVTVEDGETVVIGGLSSKEESTIHKGIPVLSSIPFIGHFFGYDKKSVSNKDLIIFVTPHIILPHKVEDNVKSEDLDVIEDKSSSK